ncbi:MAG: IS630 family transposase [Colwellia sp.]|nr:IS630 family transposase [Colwellia sp.]
MQISLSYQQKNILESRHKMSRDKRECDRIKAVLLSAEGWSEELISQALRKHKTSITRHLNDYVTSQKITSDNGGSDGYLSEAQTALVIEHLTEITYFQMKDMCEYINSTFDVKYSIPGLQKWLHHNGFSYKQPKGVPHKFDQEKQNDFIEEYTELKVAVASDEPILFMDATPPTQATKVSCGWIRTGVDKPIETTGSRTRLNIVGAIRLGHLEDAITQQYATVNGESIIDFFRLIKEQYVTDKPIHLILDGAGYHRSELVKTAANELGIELHYLPPYSPNLNPIERLWKVMSEYARNNKYFATAKEFRQSINEFFSLTLPEIGSALTSRINDNFQTFNFAV